MCGAATVTKTGSSEGSGSPASSPRSPGKKPRARQRSTSSGILDVPEKGVELEFDDFVEKILELRMDVPASALDIELCKAQAKPSDKLMNKTLKRIEAGLSSLIAQGSGQGG